MLRYSDTGSHFNDHAHAAPKPAAAEWTHDARGEPARMTASTRQDRLQRLMWQGDDELAQLVDMALALAG